MPQLNPTPWFHTTITTWATMLLLMTKLTNTPTHSAPTHENGYTHTKTTWPW